MVPPDYYSSYEVLSKQHKNCLKNGQKNVGISLMFS